MVILSDEWISLINALYHLGKFTAICRVCGRSSERQSEPPPSEWYCSLHDAAAVGFEAFLGQLCCTFQDHYADAFADPRHAIRGQQMWWYTRSRACRGESFNAVVEMSEHFQQMLDLEDQGMIFFLRNDSQY